MFTSCFLIEIDLISMILNIFHGDLHMCLARAFSKFAKREASKTVRFSKIVSSKCSGFFSRLLSGVLVSPKMNDIGCGAW